jgi:hypothetical protein
MQKSVHRSRRRRAKASGPCSPHPDGAAQGSDTPAQRDTLDARRLLDRILDTPHLARAVPRLPPQVLHRVIQNVGLEDCGDLVALATPEQLARVFDLDLWRAARPGMDEQFDADRYGVWLEVLMESGATYAAQRLAAMDADVAIAALSQYMLVFDHAAVLPSASMDGEDGEDVPAVRTVNGGLGCEIGGYLVVATRSDSWDAIVALLGLLDAEHHDYFNRVMRGCRTLSSSTPEVDGLDNLLNVRRQQMLDLAFEREQRRERQGYVTPAQARAFLQMSRHLPLGHDTAPPRNPVARAYVRAIDPAAVADADDGSNRLPAASGAPPAPDGSADAVAAVVDVLLDAGILARPPRARLVGQAGPAPRFARIETHMQFVRDRDLAACSMRTEEFAYLANTIAAGCSIQSRPFTVQEASDAAAAVCNLGLENWPPRWIQEESRRGSSAVQTGTALPDDFLVGHDLVSVFQVGWTVLHDDVCMYTAERLIGVLARLRCGDREIQTELDALRIEMTRHWRAGAPWRARDALDVMTILDMPAWATLLGLIDECPVIHAAMGLSQGSRTHEISATAFEFISGNSQIASVHEFMRLLPETLR